MRPSRFAPRNRSTLDHAQPKPNGEDNARGPDVGDEALLPLSHEMDDLWAGPSIGVMTSAQRKGLIIGAVLGGLIGAVLLQPLALVHIAGFGPLWRMFTVGIVGALAGGTAGALYLGGHLPEVEGEVPPEAQMDDFRSAHDRRGEADQPR